MRILLSDTKVVDTTSSGYQIGYQIGQWLPFLLIILGVILFIRVAYRFPSREDE